MTCNRIIILYHSRPADRGRYTVIRCVRMDVPFPLLSQRRHVSPPNSFLFSLRFPLFFVSPFVISDNICYFLSIFIPSSSFCNIHQCFYSYRYFCLYTFNSISISCHSHLVSFHHPESCTFVISCLCIFERYLYSLPS